eukprot:g5469.t1
MTSIDTSTNGKKKRKCQSPRRSSPRRIKQKKSFDSPRTVMSESYWDEAAKDYDGPEGILDNLSASISHSGFSESPLVNAVDTYSDSSVCAVDFGCGPGKHLSVLSSKFRHVVGCDISSKLLDLSRKTLKKKGSENVSLEHLDLSVLLKPKKVQLLQKPEKPSFGLCTNVLIMPDARTHIRILKNIHRVMQVNGTVIFLVPALESAIFANDRLRRWDRTAVMEDGIPFRSPGAARDLLQGIVPRGDPPVNH